jgi:chemotaxis protein MotB
MRKSRITPEEAPSHDRWLVSYSDFITLLFAFFVVLFASAYRDSHSIIRVSNSIHNGFQSLGAFSGAQSRAATGNVAQPADIMTAAQPSKNQSNGNGLSQSDLLALQKQLQSAMGVEIKSHEVEMRMTSEGFVISLKELGFFNSGKADLLPGAAEKIERIAKILSEHKLELRVEGHSDNQPIHNAEFRSNWELSTARAMTVLLLLVGQSKYDPHKISIAGYGEYRPIADDSTPDGRRMNRRVDLVVLGVNPPPGIASTPLSAASGAAPGTAPSTVPSTVH